MGNCWNAIGCDKTAIIRALGRTTGWVWSCQLTTISTFKHTNFFQTKQAQGENTNSSTVKQKWKFNHFKCTLFRNKLVKFSEIHILDEYFTLEKSALTLHLCSSQLVKLAKQCKQRSTSAHDGDFLRRSQTWFRITYTDKAHSNEGVFHPVQLSHYFFLNVYIMTMLNLLPNLLNLKLVSIIFQNWKCCKQTMTDNE